MQSMRVMHIITGLTIGGAQQLLLKMLPQMEKQGAEIKVIGLYPGEMSPEFTANGIEVEELSLGRGRYFDMPVLYDLVRKIRAFNPQVVHTHLGKADAYGRTAAKLAGVPVIISTAHNVEDWKENPLFRTIDAVTARLTDRIIACSGKVSDHISELGYIAPGKILTISNGIDVDEWNHTDRMAAKMTVRNELGLPGDIQLIGSAGRLEKQKGYSCLLRAVQQLTRLHRGFAVAVFGEGSCRGELESEGRQLGVDGIVRFPGIRRDMKKVLAALDLFVMPSLWEGLPMALLEAMASGLPVVASSVGGIPEVIRNGENGLMVPPAESDALNLAMYRCMTEPALCLRLAENARATVQGKFSVQRTAALTLDLYRELICQKIPGRA